MFISIIPVFAQDTRAQTEEMQPAGFLPGYNEALKHHVLCRLLQGVFQAVILAVSEFPFSAAAIRKLLRISEGKMQLLQFFSLPGNAEKLRAALRS